MRIALLWNDSLVRDAMATYLDSRGRFDIVTVTDNARDCLAAVREHSIHVILAEHDMMDDAQRQYLLGAKALGSFGLLFVADEDTVQNAASDVASYVSMNMSREEFFRRINAAGEPYMSVTNGRRSNKPFGLSAREYEVAKLISKGYSNRRISEETGIIEQSVKNTVSTVLRKLDCENRTQLALKILG